jgi:hypothetical protein
MEKADRRSSVGLFLHIGQKWRRGAVPGGQKEQMRWGTVSGWVTGNKAAEGLFHWFAGKSDRNCPFSTKYRILFTGMYQEFTLEISK